MKKCAHIFGCDLSRSASQSHISIFDSPSRLSKVLWGYWRRTASKSGSPSRLVCRYPYRCKSICPSGLCISNPLIRGYNYNYKGDFIMITKTISMCQGKGSLSHNNREFTAKNIDPSRTADNIVFIQQDLGDAYHQLFDEAVARYNAHQKRKDRMIDDYFQHLFNREPSKSVIIGANKQKSFYEDLVQIGTKDDTGVGTPDAEVAVACLKEYMEGFQKRNPNLYVFNAVMHLDEATPHLHINYIPVGHYDRGLDTRNAMAKALEEMNFGLDARAINRWRLKEWAVLNNICAEHGIEISEPQKSRGYSFTTAEYGEYKDTIKALEEEKAQAENERDEAQAELEKIAQKRVKLDDIDKLDTGKTMFGGKVTVAKDDWENITALAKREVASTKQVRKLKKERNEAVQKYDELKDKYDTASEELSAYKKKEKERGLFTREKLKKETARISREDELSRELRKAKAFISACGLSADFQQYKYNSTTRKKTLE